MSTSMASILTELNKNRKIRDAYTTSFLTEQFSDVIDEDFLKRISEARNQSQKSANFQMITSIIFSLCYFFKLIGIADEIKFGEYRLSTIPFGLFFFCTCALLSSCISLVRAGDSRAYDRLLRLFCEHKYGISNEVVYLSYPNLNSWGVPLQNAIQVRNINIFSKFVRFFALISVNLFLLFIIVLPDFCGIDFLFNHRVNIDIGYQSIRFWLILFLLSTNIFIFILIFWVRIIDRD
jgi:hypothetical protein